MRKPTACSHCKVIGHNKGKCPQNPKESFRVGGAFAASAPKNKKDWGKKKTKPNKEVSKRRTYVDGILEDYCDGGQSDEEDEDEEDEDEDEGRKGINYDGGDGENSDDDSPPAPEIVDLTEDSWLNVPLAELGAHDLRGHDAPKREDIKEVLPEFKGRHPGSQVNRTPMAKLVETAKEFFLLMFCVLILNQFISVTNTWGRYNTKGNKWKDVDQAEFLTFLAIILHLGVVKYPRRNIWGGKRSGKNIWTRL